MHDVQNVKNLRIAVVTAYYKEPLEILKRCHDSVLKQTYSATHFMVADGYPQEELDNWKIKHIKLPQPSVEDYGATPSCLGALEAFATGFDGVLLLDADNWFEPEHIDMLVALQKQYQVPIVTATRMLRREDESALGICPADGPAFIDTNCYLLMRETIWAFPARIVKDKRNSPPDRLFWKEIINKGYPQAHNSKPTVNYSTTWAVHYLYYGEQPPKNAKLITDVDGRCSRVPYYGFIPSSFRDSVQFARDIPEKGFFEGPQVQIIEKKFNEFCKNFVTTPFSDKSKPPPHSLIPPTIHFIWLDPPLPEKIATINIRSWKEFHPSWSIKIWTNKDADQFSWSCAQSQKAFKEALSIAEKIDIIRYEILYQFGGIYSDTDLFCLKPFHDLIANDMTFFGGLELNQTLKNVKDPLSIGNSVIGAARHSSLIKFCIDNRKTYHDHSQNTPQLRLSSGLLSKACQIVNNENILILPCSYLYPWPEAHGKLRPEEIKSAIIPLESFCIPSA